MHFDQFVDVNFRKIEVTPKFLSISSLIVLLRSSSPPPYSNQLPPAPCYALQSIRSLLLERQGPTSSAINAGLSDPSISNVGLPVFQDHRAVSFPLHADDRHTRPDTLRLT